MKEELTEALWKIRVGNYDGADLVLEPLRQHLPSEPVELSPTPSEDEYYRLRLATLIAEVSDYKGRYYAAEVALRPYDQIVKELQEVSRGELPPFQGSDDPGWLLFRQKLYYLWQRSVLAYRADAIARSQELLELALDLAGRLQPGSKALRAQLYYGAGKLAFHECREVDAIGMYRKSLTNASDHFNKARSDEEESEKARSAEESAKARDGNVRRRALEIEAARYAVGKILALGLGQSLRERGRLEEARTQVVAGRFLLNLSEDSGLANYACLLLASIERSIAGQQTPELLASASKLLDDCAESFKGHKGEVGYRWRLERALVAMQEDRLDDARDALEEMLKPTPDAKWIAEIYLALSRVARRADSHDEAIAFARKSVKAAEGLERIRRRAQVVLVLALYGAATADGEVRDDLLKETLREIEKTMVSASEPDVRTHANMLLTKVRVLNARGDIAGALETLKKYDAIKPLVEVGRIHELAELVQKELAPAMGQFRCPADLEADFDLTRNIEALRRYLIDKVSREYGTKAQQAKILGRTRTTLYTGTNKPKGR